MPKRESLTKRERIAGYKKLIKDWILHAVSVQPEIMREVAQGPIGDLHHWSRRVGTGQFCGCLIGQTAILLSKATRSEELTEFATQLHPGHTMELEPLDAAPIIVADKINNKYTARRTQRVGIAVADLGDALDGKVDFFTGSLDGNPKTKQWIRDTLNKALVARERKRKTVIKKKMDAPVGRRRV